MEKPKGSRNAAVPSALGPLRWRELAARLRADEMGIGPNYCRARLLEAHG